MLLVILYSLAATYLAIYGIHVLLLVVQYWRHRHDRPRTIDLIDNPIVTVQLPLYNEPSVVERIIDAAANLDWPRDRLQIQVLDDSTDRTTALARSRVEFHRARGVDIDLIHRNDRSGFKAGALANGLHLGQGRIRGDLRCGLHARAGFPATDDAAFRGQLDRVCASPLGSSSHRPRPSRADWRSASMGISSSSRRRAIDRACR